MWPLELLPACHSWWYGRAEGPNGTSGQTHLRLMRVGHSVWNKIAAKQHPRGRLKNIYITWNAARLMLLRWKRTEWSRSLLQESDWFFFFSPHHVNVKGSTSLILHSVHHMQTQTPHWYLASVGRQCSTALYDVLYCFQKVYVEWFWGRRGGAHES